MESRKTRLKCSLYEDNNLHTTSQVKHSVPAPKYSRSRQYSSWKRYQSWTVSTPILLSMAHPFLNAMISLQAITPNRESGIVFELARCDVSRCQYGQDYVRKVSDSMPGLEVLFTCRENPRLDSRGRSLKFPNCIKATSPTNLFFLQTMSIQAIIRVSGQTSILE